MNSDDPEVIQVAQYLQLPSLILQESYAVTGNWSGDIERGFSASIDSQVAEELLNFPGISRGDQLDAQSAAAVRFVANSFGESVDWFPSSTQVSNQEFFVIPISIDADGEYIDSARLVLLDLANRLLFYAWVKF